MGAYLLVFIKFNLLKIIHENQTSRILDDEECRSMRIIPRLAIFSMTSNVTMAG